MSVVGSKWWLMVINCPKLFSFFKDCVWDRSEFMLVWYFQSFRWFCWYCWYLGLMGSIVNNLLCQNSRYRKQPKWWYSVWLYFNTTVIQVAWVFFLFFFFEKHFSIVWYTVHLICISHIKDFFYLSYNVLCYTGESRFTSMRNHVPKWNVIMSDRTTHWGDVDTVITAVFCILTRNFWKLTYLLGHRLTVVTHLDINKDKKKKKKKHGF